MERFREPTACNRGVGEGTCAQVGIIAFGKSVRWVAHAIEALGRIQWIKRQLQRRCTIRFTWRFHPHIGVQTRCRRGLWALTNTTGLVTPIAAMDTTINAGLIDKGINLGTGGLRWWTIRTTPAIARCVDQHADRLRESRRNHFGSPSLHKRYFAEVRIPLIEFCLTHLSATTAARHSTIRQRVQEGFVHRCVTRCIRHKAGNGAHTIGGAFDCIGDQSNRLSEVIIPTQPT